MTIKADGNDHHRSTYGNSISRSLIPLSAHTPHAMAVPYSCGVTASIGARGITMNNE